MTETSAFPICAHGIGNCAKCVEPAPAPVDSVALKSCAHCGDDQAYIGKGRGSSGWFVVTCYKCGASTGPRFPESLAVNAWNERADLAKDDELSEAMIEAGVLSYRRAWSANGDESEIVARIYKAMRAAQVGGGV